uniref:Galactosyltransferase N-terminal domain-containing protein n=1 Tax=Meloidogyne javanica TaxID=6303 RepID=A0A915M560_MELJA
MSINPATKITLRTLIAAYILINETGLRRISRINLIKIKSKIEEEMPQKKEEIKVTGQDNLTLCPENPPNQKGKIDVDMRSLKLEEIEEEYKYLWPGGHWRPKECKSRQKVAIVVPYRVYPFDCIIFHDVDTYPENDNLLYRCSTDPKVARHLSVYLERAKYIVKLANMSFTRSKTNISRFRNTIHERDSGNAPDP